MEKSKFKVYNYRWIILILFIGLGVFNSVNTWIKGILNPRNFTITQGGIVSSVMITAGINSPATPFFVWTF